MGKAAQERAFAPSAAADDGRNTLGMGLTDRRGDHHHLWPLARSHRLIIVNMNLVGRCLVTSLPTSVTDIEVRTT